MAQTPQEKKCIVLRKKLQGYAVTRSGKHQLNRLLIEYEAALCDAFWPHVLNEALGVVTAAVRNGEAKIEVQHAIVKLIMGKSTTIPMPAGDPE